MSVRAWLAARLAPPAAPEPPEPAYRPDPCPDCGEDWLVIGAQSVRHESNGARARITTGTGVLTCLGCGARWYGTPTGLRRPHELAIPPGWAAQDAQARARAALPPPREVNGRDTKPGRQRVAPNAGFRRPPPADEE